MAQTDPIAEFRKLFEKAKLEEGEDATACALATADETGRPSVRMVLLKAVDESGFVFYTNFGSRKAAELDVNPNAALCFHWHSLGQQARIEGPVERVSDEEADAYYASRARLSQLGAWASKQSQPLGSAAELVARVAKIEARYAGRPIPRPPFWGGFRVRPIRVELWSNRPHRLHDRRLFTAGEEGWVVQRLYP